MKALFVGALALFLGLFPLTRAVKAEDSSKIYLGDQWVAADSREISVPAKNSLFGDLLPTEKILNPSQIVQKFLQRNANLLNVDKSTSWKVTQTISGPELQTQRIHKQWNGLPVLGGEAVVHLSSGRVAFANADNTSLSPLSVTALIQADAARAVAFASYRGRALGASTPELKVLVRDFNGQGNVARLVYEVTVHDRDQFASDIHFIDAQTAEEVMVSTNVHTLTNRQVLIGEGSESDFSLDESNWKTIFADKGCSLRAPAAVSASTNASAIPSPCLSVDAKILNSAKAAWTNSGLVHQYFHTTHQRNSIDGNGMTMKSVVNFGGTGFPNAAWYNDKGLMLYGLGDETKFNDFASPLDVAAHEITHGVTSRTSNLEYVAESGALNESYSDVFGKLVAFKNNKGTDWKLGRELFKDGVGFVRDMENPEVGHTKDFMYRNQQCSRINDFCGVHTNSGIPNRAAVLLSKKIGNDKLGRLYYLTLTQLLRTNSSFKEAKAQTEAACAKLFGAGSSDCRAVTESFAAVGI